MSKREFVGVMVLLTGLLLFNASETTLVGVVLLAGGAYMLALPYLAGHRAEIDREARY